MSPCIFLLMFISIVLPNQPSSAFLSVEAMDTPDDDGNSITIEWELSTDDKRGEGQLSRLPLDVTQYTILRDDSGNGEMRVIGQVPADVRRYVDDKVKRGNSYYYIVRAQDRAGNIADSAVIGPVTPSAQWFKRAQAPTALGIFIFSGIAIFCIYYAKSNRQPFIRKISGIDAIDEAVGRATEMGRPVLYVSGTGSIRSIATIASMNILARVARMTAKYDTTLSVPCSDPVVMNIEREVVKNAHLDVGRPDTYRQENIFFVSEEQFAYAAALNGIIVRDRPSAIFYMGSFLAESLILAEVGSSAGAIQIAGTDSITQLPFFITTCDHTLMGEELYAASAYLSRDPLLLGSLKGQDWGKLLVAIVILASVILQIMGFNWFVNLFRV